MSREHTSAAVRSDGCHSSSVGRHPLQFFDDSAVVAALSKTARIACAIGCMMGIGLSADRPMRAKRRRGQCGAVVMASVVGCSGGEVFWGYARGGLADAGQGYAAGSGFPGSHLVRVGSAGLGKGIEKGIALPFPRARRLVRRKIRSGIRRRSRSRRRSRRACVWHRFGICVGIATGYAVGLPPHVCVALLLVDVGLPLAPDGFHPWVSAAGKLGKDVRRWNAAGHPGSCLRCLGYRAAPPLVAKEADVRPYLLCRHVDRPADKVIRVELKCWCFHVEIKSPHTSAVTGAADRSR